MEKFNNKYRIPSARLQNWDYGADAIYFVTICTADHAHYFGTINDGQMRMNDIGMIAHHSWLDIPNYYPSVLLDAHVVMPNHIHGMLIIDNDRKHDAKTLGVIINQYKRFVTINARLKNINFAWQTRFHDHIVRNNDSFQNVQDYIQENPLRWMDDKFYG